MLVITHLTGLVGYTLLIRKSTFGSLNKLLMSALMQTAVFVPSLIFLSTGRVSFNYTVIQWLFLILGGFMLAGLMVTNVWALTHLDASVFTILYNLRLLVVTILAYMFLGESPPTLQIVGGLIILVSIIFLNLHKGSKWKSRPMLIGLFAMLWFSFHAVLEKYNLQQIPIESYLFIFSAIGTVMIWALILVKKINFTKEIAHIRDKKIYGLLIARVISAYGYVYALKFGSLAVTNYVSGMSVALIVLFGIYILNEREYIKQKLISVLVACLGLTLILFSKL
jgi:drug/metabolite transporter (DMT)-like permease